MQLDFQKKIASSQITLPVVCIIAVALWLILPHPGTEAVSAFATADYGLWQLVPPFLQQGYWGLGLGLAFVAGGVYLLAELNNSNVLLRISSRMLSSTLAVLCALAVSCHTVHPGSILMLFSLLSFFALFATYQLPSPMLAFSAFLMLSASSLVFPKMLLLVPCYWVLQGYLRAFSFRCFIASLLATILPYWFYACIAFSLEALPMFVEHIQSLITFQWYDYTQLTLSQILPFAFFFILFVTGATDFARNSFLDKTRTRIIYNVVIVHCLYIIIYICLQPQYLDTLLPVILVDVSILFGHFFALTYTRFSHILSLVLLVLGIAMCAYLTLALLPPNFPYLIFN